MKWCTIEWCALNPFPTADIQARRRGLVLAELAADLLRELRAHRREHVLAELALERLDLLVDDGRRHPAHEAGRGAVVLQVAVRALRAPQQPELRGWRERYKMVRQQCECMRSGDL